MLIIKDKEGCVYGGYASQPWEKHSDFYGDMKSFLFSAHPKAAVYRPTGKNANLQWVSLTLHLFLFPFSFYSTEEPCVTCNAKQSLHVNGMEELSDLEQKLEAWGELGKGKERRGAVESILLVLLFTARHIFSQKCQK